MGLILIMVVFAYALALLYPDDAQRLLPWLFKKDKEK